MTPYLQWIQYFSFNVNTDCFQNIISQSACSVKQHTTSQTLSYTFSIAGCILNDVHSKK